MLEKIDKFSSFADRVKLVSLFFVKNIIQKSPVKLPIRYVDL